MNFSFDVGSDYSRKDIYKIIGMPVDTKGGVWDTGYARHTDDSWFIFVNIGTPGRTGHDYDNHWIGDQLIWFGKNNTNLNQPSIKSITSGKNEIYIFWREHDGAKFTFAGLGKIESIEDTSPVKVTWSFDSNLFPDEVPVKEKYTEGSVKTVTVNLYERNPLARQKCLEHYGTSCFVCKFDFADVYGSIGAGFIHVHHLKPISEVGDTYEIDPIKDLRPVCPNCHAIIHKKSPPIDIDQMVEIFKSKNKLV